MRENNNGFIGVIAVLILMFMISIALHFWSLPDVLFVFGLYLMGLISGMVFMIIMILSN